MISDLSRLVVAAILISIPFSWFIMSRWLDNFAYRIEMDSWIFGLAGSLALAVAIGTVSFQSIKAALQNPMESLQHE
jgi:putative ABC transport system permease protein